MRVAIVHDDLMRRGGAEQVVLSMLKAFPQADVFTLCYRTDSTYAEFKSYKIRTSLFNLLARNETWMKSLFFPFGLLCMKLLKVKNYDVVLISNTYCAKYISIDKKARIFIYTYTPFRLAWNPASYQQYNNSTGLKRSLFDFVVRVLRHIDFKEAQKGDFFLGMTKETVERIKTAYKVSHVDIIHPDVKCRNFYIGKESSDYYLVVSRLEFYKKVDLAIEAFNALGTKLIIVGNGSNRKSLMQLSKVNIEFRSGLSSKEVADLYANCRALIFPQHEDYGITPLEANASGRPVIAYGLGGVTETMIPYDGSSEQFTAVFFQQQNKEALIGAIKLFETLTPDPEFIRQHAEKFDESVFINEIKEYIQHRV